MDYSYLNLKDIFVNEVISMLKVELLFYPEKIK